MGVKYLFSYVKKTYINAFVSKPKLDVLYLEGNSMLYAIATITKDPTLIAKMLISVCKEYSKEFGTIHLYMDGSPNMAKIKQQRSRRFQYDPISYVTTSIEKGTKSDIVEVGKSMIYPWSPAMFSTGTDMMYKIHEYLDAHWNTQFPNSIYSSYFEPHEGEHKIMDHIRSTYKNTKNPVSIGIVGKDADLILLAMGIAEDYNVNMYILRHDDILSPNGYTVSDPIHYINTNMLRNLILSSTATKSIWDFIFCTFLHGNDFLPPVPEFSNIYETMPLLLPYIPSGITSSTNTDISWSKFIELMKYMYQTVNVNYDYIQFEEDIDEKWISKNRATDDLSLEQFESLYYFTASSFPVDKKRLFLGWLITLKWTYTYYRYGPTKASIKWQYPTYFSPSIHTIISTPITPEYIDFINNTVQEQVQPLSPIQTLISILPIWLHDLIPTTTLNSTDKVTHENDTKEKLMKLRDFIALYPYSFDFYMGEPKIPIITYEIASSF